MKQIAEYLKERAIKVTPQRIAIYGYLSKVRTHPTAETIYKSLEKEYPTISLATVYKTLCTLKNYNLVQELSVGDGIARYDSCVKNHYHFICNKCHNIFDIEADKTLTGLQHNITENTGFNVQSSQLYLYGNCPDCNQ